MGPGKADKWLEKINKYSKKIQSAPAAARESDTQGMDGLTLAVKVLGCFFLLSSPCSSLFEEVVPFCLRFFSTTQ